MNNKLLIGFFGVLLVLFLGLPLVAGVVQKNRGDSGGAAAPVEKAPPLLKTANLTGTAWEVKTPDIPVAVTIALNPGGQAVATVPPAFSALAKQMIGTDTLMGTWKAEGAVMTASVSFKGEMKTVQCDIIGDKIYFKDKEITRVR
ncbi:MAG: hypothetical protein IT368_18165 [Candidatus Hydrogenedentes bacterium]|nr:hypothetical protein [Candidatus Hydrogenedentota bacterium]